MAALYTLAGPVTPTQRAQLDTLLEEREYPSTVALMAKQCTTMNDAAFVLRTLYLHPKKEQS